MPDRKLQIIPLGGVGQFGLNMMLMRCAGEAIIVDAGMGFPDDEPGINILIPDFSVVRKYRDEITGIFLTHGHEDHIGAVPFLLRELQVPVYGTRLTLARVEHKLQEHRLDSGLLHPIEAGANVKLNAFDVEFIHVSHSLTWSTALAVRTPCGVVIHSGDFKIDYTPVLGAPINLKPFKNYGDSGVLALLADSTNAEIPGMARSEKAVIPALAALFEAATGRIIVTCFSTSTHRIQIIMDLAEEFGRKVLVLGRSMMNSIEISEELRHINLPEGVLISAADAKHIRPDELVILASGSQGEPRSAMMRLATDQHKGLSIGPGDLIIHSARVIPGRDRAISRLISHCYKRGARVVDNSIALVHVSGHACQEELKQLLEGVRPKFLIPIHGELRQLHRHKEWAASVGLLAPEQIIMFENGDVLELDSSTATIVGQETVGRTFIDSGLGEVDGLVVRDRRNLSYDGVVTAIVTINPTSGELESQPEIVSRGFVDAEGRPDFIASLETLVEATVKNASHESRIDAAVMQEEIRLALKRFIKKNSGRQPMIIPVVLEI
ncbi:MAG TPA: ribonuclease J [Pyrinomonadaceae bacterium]|nr:ribonuclease J [Pyrinomonadaceae bacterium]